VGDARFDLWSLYLRWFDRWLRGDTDALAGVPRVQYFLMGRNEWRSADDWPVPGTRFTALHLGSTTGANGLNGDGRLTADSPEPGYDAYVYDPASPAPSLGGPLCCTASKEALPGSYDQREVEIRHDVLVYSSEPLKSGLEVTGPLQVVLYVSSDAPDTDFTAKLVDVYPDGRAFNVQEGILRARYREGFDRKVFMEPGQVYELAIDLQATANWFGPEHRIRLEISSSNFPRFDRNLNTGGNNYDESEFAAARNTIHFGGDHPSRLILPIVAGQPGAER
jgi:putative CocE/NonD family hydrolase